MTKYPTNMSGPTLAQMPAAIFMLFGRESIPFTCSWWITALTNSHQTPTGKQRGHSLAAHTTFRKINQCMALRSAYSLVRHHVLVQTARKRAAGHAHLEVALRVAERDLVLHGRRGVAHHKGAHEVGCRCHALLGGPGRVAGHRAQAGRDDDRALLRLLQQVWARSTSASHALVFGSLMTTSPVERLCHLCFAHSSSRRKHKQRESACSDCGADVV